MNDELRQLCQTLRAEGVKRVMFEPESGAPTLLEFFDAAAAIPTDAESASAPERTEEKSGFEQAIEIMRHGAAPAEKQGEP